MACRRLRLASTTPEVVRGNQQANRQCPEVRAWRAPIGYRHPGYVDPVGELDQWRVLGRSTPSYRARAAIPNAVCAAGHRLGGLTRARHRNHQVVGTDPSGQRPPPHPFDRDWISGPAAA